MAANIVIDIVVSGLIAFVPNTVPTPTYFTAYLVKDEYHKPTLSAYGSVFLEKNEAGGPCSITDGCEKGSVVSCDLNNTRVKFERDVRTPRVPPNRPSQERPSTSGINGPSSKDWIVRMKNLEDGIGKVDRDKLKDYTQGEIEFGYDSIEVTALDGSEAGKKILVGFKNAEGKESSLKQVVAEGVAFRTTFKEPPIRIRIFNYKTGKESVVAIRCKKSHCVSIDIDNSAISRGCDDGHHFERYYDLVGEDGSRFIPYSIDRRECIEMGKQSKDLQLLPKVLQIIRPIAPKKVAVIENAFPWKDVKNQADLHRFIVSLDKRKSAKGFAPAACVADLVLSMLIIQDRPICPPVVLEP